MSKQKILEILHEDLGNYISVDNLLENTGISEKQLKDYLSSLEMEGYPIEYSQGKGYRIIKTPSLLLPYEIQKGLQTKYVGQKIYYYKQVKSTNEVAKELAEEGAPEGTIIIAESQSSGRGRWGKKWISPKGGVWMTIILRPDIEPARAAQLTLVTGVAVARTLQGECGLDVGIKWPNDILIGDKKVCGILTEANAIQDSLEYVVVGVGIDLNVDVNLFPPDLREGATSLKLELEREIPGAKLVQRFLENFEQLYNQFREEGFIEILKEWRKLSSTIGSYVEVHKKGRIVQGEAVGINREGALILELDDGNLRKIISGECIHIKR